MKDPTPNPARGQGGSEALRWLFGKIQHQKPKRKSLLPWKKPLCSVLASSLTRAAKSDAQSPWDTVTHMDGGSPWLNHVQVCTWGTPSPLTAPKFSCLTLHPQAPWLPARFATPYVASMGAGEICRTFPLARTVHSHTTGTSQPPALLLGGGGQSIAQ